MFDFKFVLFPTAWGLDHLDLWTQGVSRHPTVVVRAEAARKPLGQVDVNPTWRDVASVS